jgi:hypothetical protein
VEWKDVKGFDEYYKISDQGDIIRKERIIERKSHGTFVVPEKKISPVYDKDGYLKTAFRVDGKRYYRRVHRLVAETFLNNPNNYPVVNHKNGIKDDNRVENLEWCTVAENTQHAFDVLGRIGQNGGTNKRVAKINKETGELLEVFESIKEAADSVNTKTTCIWRAMQRDDYTSHGFKWEYYNEGVTTIENNL